MEISVALPDATDAEGLVQRLSGALDATVSLDVGRKEIRVRPGSESDRAVLCVVDVVSGWLAQGCVTSARLTLGDRSYTLSGGGRIASPG